MFNTNTYLISKQKQIARQCIDIFQKISIQSVIAGGAPRDWLILEEPGKDLDIFYTVPDGDWTPDELTTMLQEHFGFVQNATLSDELREKYTNLNPSIFSVHNWTFDGVDVQFIGCLTDVETRHENFSLNVSQIKWSPNSGYSCTKEFTDCHYGHKEIRQINNGFNLFGSYISRINLKFMRKGYTPLIFTEGGEIKGG